MLNLNRFGEAFPAQPLPGIGPEKERLSFPACGTQSSAVFVEPQVINHFPSRIGTS
jgi:hypothetical protein